MFQPAVGFWKTSPRHVLLWATLQVLDKVKREQANEETLVAAWEAKVERALLSPVDRFPWNELTVSKADKPRVPSDVAAGLGAVEDMIPELWLEAATLAGKMEGLPFDPDDLARAVRSVGDMVSSIGPNAAERLQTIMAEVYAEAARGGNVSQFDFARAIRREWAGTTASKAKQIAVTEWNRAASGATLISYQRQGIATKMWITVGDERVCAMCDANSSQGEIGINDEFVSGVDAPPSHPSCRCSMAGGLLGLSG